MNRTGRARLAVCLAALGLAAGGCTSAHTLDIPTPRAVAGPTTTAPAVTTTVAEQPVAGEATSTSAIVGHGSARINGTVLGPAGPVEGATVEVRRYVDDSSATIEATTAADGSFDVERIVGGRYQVRAWQTPSLAEASPQDFFLAASGTQTLDLRLASYSGLKVATDVKPLTPFVGQPVNLAVEVTQATVDGDGNVSQVPQASVTVRLESTNMAPFGGGPTIATTGQDGEAILGITCTQGGPAPIDLLVGGSTTVSVETPVCLVPATTTTPTTLPPETTAPGTTAPTTTTHPTTTARSTTTTTATTAPTTTAPTSTTPTTEAPTTTARGATGATTSRP